MNIKYIFSTLVAGLALLTSCNEDQTLDTLDSVSLSKTFVTFPKTGGSEEIELQANGDWKIYCPIAVTVKDENGKNKNIVKDSIPTWLTVAPHISGAAGKETLTFSVGTTTETNAVTLQFQCNGKTQYVNILQQTEKVELPLSTCADVIAGADGNTYKIRGTVTGSINTLYGNYNVTDETGSVYIYGTLDAEGNEKNFSSWGIEAGDIVTVQGPKKTYNGTIELEKVEVIKIEKSLIKVDSLSVDKLPKGGGEIIAYVTNKGEGMSVEIPEEAQSWLSVKSINTSGTSATVTFRAAANEGGDRNVALEFITTSKGVEYTATTEFAQEGSILPVTCAEFNAAPVGSAQYRLIGLVTKVANEMYGNIYVQDYTGSVYVYGTTNYSDYPVKAGDVVNIVGPRAEYKGSPQMQNGTIDELCASAEPISLADFNAAADDNDKYYLLTGKITEIANDKFGNVYIEDETGAKVYLYGVYGDWTGVNKQYFIKDNGIAVGDEITVVTIKTSYNGAAQGKNAVCFGVKKAE